MDMKTLDRAREIQGRLAKLETMRKWLEDEKRNTYMIGPVADFNMAVSLSPDMQTVLLGMCMGESVRLQKEFENL